MAGRAKIAGVAYFTSEHPRHPVGDLVSGRGRWTCPPSQSSHWTPAGSSQLEAEFTLARPTNITGLDLGNYWSSSLQVSVGREGWPRDRREVLLQERVLMNRLQCSSGENKEQMLMLRSGDFNPEVVGQLWTRLRVTCSQPFKFNHDSFGLSLLVLHGKEEVVEGKENMASSGVAALQQRLERSSVAGVAVGRVPAALLSLENTVRLGEEGRKAGGSLDQAAMSRSAKLVARALGPGAAASGAREQGEKKVTDPLRHDCLMFLHSCKFDRLTFAEIEAVTFRRVKELWQERRQAAMTAEQKGCLKPLSVKYLSSLVTRTRKRALEGEEEVEHSKRRRVSSKVLEMRRRDAMEEEVLEEGGGSRNRLVTMDRVRAGVKVKEGVKPGLGLFKSKPVTPPKARVKEVTPSKSKTVATPGKAEFDLGEVEEEDEVEVVRDVKAMRALKAASEVVEVEDDDEKVKDVKMKEVKVTQEVKVKQEVKQEAVLPRAPVYRRQRLLDFTQKELILAGVLVQVYNYKKTKELPLKGGKTLSVEKGVPATFYKVGPDIHLEVGGRFHLPDVAEEHMGRLFKNFQPGRVSETGHPPGLQALLARKENGKVDAKLDGKVDVKVDGKGDGKEDGKVDGVKETEEDAEKKSKPESSRTEKCSDTTTTTSSPTPCSSRSSSPCSSCPLCSLEFPLEELAQHAASCTGPRECGFEEGRTAACPICGLELQVEALEQHANTCAAAMFGS